MTPAGRQVLDRARSVALQMDDIQKLADGQDEPLSNSLVMGVIPTIGPYLLPRVLPPMQERYPKLQLQIIEDETDAVLDLLRRGALDTAVIALPYECHGLLSFPFRQEDLYWVTHSNDRLAALTAVTEDDLRQAQLMLLKDGHCLTDHALAACKLEHLSSQPFSATSLTTIIQLVAAIDYVALVFRSDLRPESNIGKVSSMRKTKCAIPLLHAIARNGVKTPDSPRG